MLLTGSLRCAKNRYAAWQRPRTVLEVYNVADDESDEGGEEEGLLQSQADAQEVFTEDSNINVSSFFGFQKEYII